MAVGLGGWAAVVALAASASTLTTLVAGERFVPVSASVGSQCQATANAMGYPALCPRYLPASYDGNLDCSRGGGGRGGGPLIGTGCGRRRGDNWRDWEFATVEWPSTKRVSHLVIQSAPRVVSAEKFVFGPTPGVIPDVPVRRVETFEGRGIHGAWWAVGHSSSTAFGGHMVLVWYRQGRTYGVGFHGLDPASRLLGGFVASTATYRRPHLRG